MMTSLERIKSSAKYAFFLALLLLAHDVLAEQTSSGAPTDAKNKIYALRGRSVQVNIWLSQGFFGESAEGLLVSRGTLGPSLTQAMKDENADREALFKSEATKLGTTVMAQKKLFAKKRANEAPAGSPVQEADGSWKLKTS